MSCRINRPDRRLHLTTCTKPFEENACIQGGVHRRPAGLRRPDVLRRDYNRGRKEYAIQKSRERTRMRGGGGMNALPPSGSPAACVRGAGRRGPRPIGPCAGTAAKNDARLSAQDARRPRRPANNTAAETRNGAASLHATGAGGAIGHGRTLARARAVAHIDPLKAARCANRAAWQGVTGSGNNMPRGGPPACAAGAARPRPVMPRIATGAPGAWPSAQEKRRRMQEAASATSSGEYEGFV